MTKISIFLPRLQRCHKCTGSISGEELVMRVGQNSYHVECFSCDYCQRRLHVSHCDVINNRLLRRWRVIVHNRAEIIIWPTTSWEYAARVATTTMTACTTRKGRRRIPRSLVSCRLWRNCSVKLLRVKGLIITFQWKTMTRYSVLHYNHQRIHISHQRIIFRI